MRIFDNAHPATPRHGTARHGTARHGTARHGNYTLSVLLALFCLLLPASPANATCTRNPALSTHENSAVPIPFGRVNLQNEVLQPFGSLLASVAVLPAYRNLPPDTPLWSCHVQDIERHDLHFLVATNGNLGDIGGNEGLKNISATWFTEYAHVGLRQRMDEVEFSRTWKRVELRAFQYDAVNGYIHIRIRDLPTLSAELYKVSQTPKFQNTQRFCGGLGFPMPDARYTCHLPSSYIQFVGPGLPHDREQQDSHTNRKGINANNGFGYRLFNAMTLTQKPSCAVLGAPQAVHFPELSISEIERGKVLTAPLSIVFRCSMSAASGTGEGKTAIAVGSRRRRYFADPANPGSALGETSGWYPFMRDGQQLPNPNKRDVELKLEARLRRLPGQTVTPGKIHATARVVIKVP